MDTAFDLTGSVSALRRYKHLYIGGEWVEPLDGGLTESIDPATGRPWAVVPMAGVADVDRAVAAATQAFEGPWRRMPGHERAALLRRFADLFRDAVPDLAVLESRDCGGCIRDLRVSLAAQAQYYQWFASLADKAQGRTVPIDDTLHAFTTLEPLGVVAAITPWNVPLFTICVKIGPALAAGCTVILKPSEHTSVTALELARLAHEAGFPPGVFNVVPGFGHVAGLHLVKHPGVNRVTFTGERNTARKILNGERIEAGMVWINTYNATRWSAPFGGFKASGWDREMGIDALAPFLETRTTMINLTGRFPNFYADCAGAIAKPASRLRDAMNRSIRSRTQLEA